jgi:hypothetical protein
MSKVVTTRPRRRSMDITVLTILVITEEGGVGMIYFGKTTPCKVL